MRYEHYEHYEHVWLSRQQLDYKVLAAIAVQRLRARDLLRVKHPRLLLCSSQMFPVLIPFLRGYFVLHSWATPER
jgi:hypothetical protein